MVNKLRLTLTLTGVLMTLVVGTTMSTQSVIGSGRGCHPILNGCSGWWLPGVEGPGVEGPGASDVAPGIEAKVKPCNDNKCNGQDFAPPPCHPILNGCSGDAPGSIFRTDPT